MASLKQPMRVLACTAYLTSRVLFISGLVCLSSLQPCLHSFTHPRRASEPYALATMA